jgi:hypothetical protein
MLSKILSGNALQQSRQVGIVVGAGLLFAWNTAVYFFVPNSQAIQIQPLSGIDTAINPTMKLLYLGLVVAFLMVALSLVRRPVRWLLCIVFCIALFAIGSYLKSTLNIALDKSMPKLTSGTLKGISKETRYGKTLLATIQDGDGRLIQMSTRYDLSRNLVQVWDSKVAFYLCAGYFEEPYICSNSASK